MKQDYSDLQLSGDAQPSAVYYTEGRNNASRRQQKRQLLLTFINHTTTPKRKRNRTAPVKPSLLHTLLAMLA